MAKEKKACAKSQTKAAAPKAKSCKSCKAAAPKAVAFKPLTKGEIVQQLADATALSKKTSPWCSTISPPSSPRAWRLPTTRLSPFPVSSRSKSSSFPPKKGRRTFPILSILVRLSIVPLVRNTTKSRSKPSKVSKTWRDLTRRVARSRICSSGVLLSCENGAFTFSKPLRLTFFDLLAKFYRRTGGTPSRVPRFIYG